MYYDCNQTLSRQRLFNFVVGPRGAGKTFGAKRRAIDNYIKRGEQFVYLRRYETEMPAAEMRNFFDDIAYLYPERELKAGKGLFTADKEVMGWYFPLSKAVMLKSIPFPRVSLIIFDEFIIDVGIYHYLPKEVHTFLEAYSTISRDRDIPVLFLSNAITFTNPYFIYFDLALEAGQKVKLLPDISLELVENPDYIQHAKSTRFGKLVEKTQYGAYAMNNQFLRDNDVFIEAMSEPNYYICTLLLQSMQVGIYRGRNSGLWYATPNVDPSCIYRIAIEEETHNTTTLYSRAGGQMLRGVVQAYCDGSLRFSSRKIKNLICETFRRIL